MGADFSVLLFSLGLDLDVDDEGDDPFIPNPPIQEGNEGEDPKSSDALMRMRRDPPPAPPSFSLGLDPNFEEEGLTVPDSPIQEDDRPVLKRLKRGPPPAAAMDEEGDGKFDDDIEDFSSQEDGDRRRQPDISPSLQSHATCSSSKISLHSRGVLSSQSTSRLRAPMISTAYNASASKSLEASSNKDMFPRGQSCPRDGPSNIRATNRKGSARSSKPNQKRPSSANCKEALSTTGNWVDTRSNATVPKDAGKRRVSAVGSQGGHWYTGRDGRKVYISQNGQELTGQAACRHYRKDSGTGFRRSNKNAATKKKRK